MPEGIFFFIKLFILTEILTNAVRTWGIFDGPRSWVKRRLTFFRKLLDCFECTSVWAGTFALAYLLWFEITFLTWVLIAHRVACFINIAYLNFDAARANKEEDLRRKLEGAK